MSDTGVSPDDMVEVVVDSREPKNLLGDVAAHPLVANVDQRTLEHGDLRIGEDVLIERKTPSDLASSIVDNRLFEQVRGMAESDPEVVVVLLEGNLTDATDLRYSSLPAAAIHGAVASTLVRAGVPILSCGTREALVDVGIRLGQKAVEEHDTAFGQVEFDHDNSLPPTLSMFGAIPGVGPTTAEALYERYPSIADAVMADPEDFEAIDGIGPKTAATIATTLEANTQ